MALSSVSVVINSLLLNSFRPGHRNILSSIAPGVMTVFFLAIFWQFSQAGNIAEAGSSYTANNPSLLSNINSFMATSRVKIGFDGLGLPKTFFGTDTLPQGLEVQR